MNQAIPLTINHQTIAHIKRLAGTASHSPEGGQALYGAIKALPVVEQAELLALYRLGQSRRTAFNQVAAAAKRQDPQFIAGQLAEKSNLVKFLNAGLKRYAKQS